MTKRSLGTTSCVRSFARNRHAGSMHILCNIVKLVGPLIPDLATFHAKFVPNERIVPGSFFQALLQLAAKNEKLRLFLMALLKAEYLCPADKVVNKHCAFITSGDIAACGKKLSADALAGEAVLRIAREMVEKNKDQIDNDAAARLLGPLDCNMARFVVQKQKSSKVEYQSDEAIGTSFWKDLQDKLGDKCPPNPWSGSCQAAQSPQSGMSASMQGPDGMASYTATGELIPDELTKYLKQQGFSTSDIIVPKKSKDEKETILSIGASVEVKLENNSVESYGLKQFLATFRIRRGEAPVRS